METNRIEYKAKLSDTFEKEVVAFLNYRGGGIIYLGIDKHGKAIGIANIDQIQLVIKDRLKNNIVPSCMGLFDLVAEQRNGRDVLKVIVASGSERPYYIKKYGMSERGAFIRTGSASEPMSAHMIETLFARRIRNSIGKIRSPKQDLNFEQFFEGISIPKNKELMRIFRDLDLVEQLGSGIPRILRAYGKECFYFSENYIRMSFPSIEGLHVTENVVENVVENEKRVLELIKDNNRCSALQMADLLHLTQRTVQRYLKQLQAKGIIERIGPAKGGYWKIKE